LAKVAKYVKKITLTASPYSTSVSLDSFTKLLLQTETNVPVLERASKTRNALTYEQTLRNGDKMPANSGEVEETYKVYEQGAQQDEQLSQIYLAYLWTDLRSHLTQPVEIVLAPYMNGHASLPHPPLLECWEGLPEWSEVGLYTSFSQK
jgi:hypothetical protein